MLLYSLVVKLLFGMRKLAKLMSDHVLRDEHRRVVLPVVYQETDPIQKVHHSTRGNVHTTCLPYKVGQNSA